MAIPSVTGGAVILELCRIAGQTSGIAPPVPLSGSLVNDATSSRGTSTRAVRVIDGFTYIPSGQIQSAYISGEFINTYGRQYPITSVDLTGKIFYAMTQSYNTIGDASVNTGLMVGFNSDSNGANEALWVVGEGDSDKYSTYPFEVSLINPLNSTNTHEYTVGFDPTDITNIIIAFTKSGTSGRCFSYQFGYQVPYILVGGTVGAESSFADIKDFSFAQGVFFYESPSNSFNHLLLSYDVGDGSTETNYSESLTAFQFIRHFSVTEKSYRAQLLDNDLGFKVNAGALDTIEFSTCNWLSDSKFYWEQGLITGASVVFSSCNIQNAGRVIIADGITHSFCVFDSCDIMTSSSPTLTNCTISSTTDTASIVATDTSNITGTSFIGNAVAIRIEVNGTYDFDSMTFSGNTTDLEFTGTGTCTVNIVNGSDVPTYTTTNGGTVVIQNNATLSLNNIAIGSRYYVVDTATGLIEYANAIATATTETVTISLQVTSLDLTIKVRKGSSPVKYQPFNTQASLVTGGASVFIAQVEDNIAL
tara:strand:- start:2863 stop:4461 length:1599 start_codon:yes stop_codon:yes gene_type:complete